MNVLDCYRIAPPPSRKSWRRRQKAKREWNKKNRKLKPMVAAATRSLSAWFWTLKMEWIITPAKFNSLLEAHGGRSNKISIWTNLEIINEMSYHFSQKNSLLEAHGGRSNKISIWTFWTFSIQEQLCSWPNSTAYLKSIAATTRSLSEQIWTL